MRRVTLGLVLTLAATASLAAEVYTWKDKDGRTHYSDTPPPAGVATGLKEQSVQQPLEGAGTSPKALNEQMRSLNERQAKRTEEAKKQDAQAQQQAAQKQYCDSIRNRMAQFETGGRLSRMVDGERVIYTDEERAAEMAQMRSQLSKDCKG